MTVPLPQHDFFICLFFCFDFSTHHHHPFLWLDKVFSEFTPRLQAFSHTRFLYLATKICNVFQSLLFTKKCSNLTINSCSSFFSPMHNSSFITAIFQTFFQAHFHFKIVIDESNKNPNHIQKPLLTFGCPCTMFIFLHLKLFKNLHKHRYSLYIDLHEAE